MNRFFSKLPNYYKIHDTYKDNNDQGLLERYLSIFDLEIDNEVKPLIDNYLDNIDPFTIDPKYLTTLGYTLGSPPDLHGSNADYAKLLAYIISVYKIKGTLKAYQLLFALLGYNVSIIEYAPDEEFLFDDGNLFDDDPLPFYDAGCPCCSDYSIVVNVLLNSGGNCTDPNNTSIDNTILPTFIAIVEFNQPINANLLSIISGGLVCEEVEYCYNDAVTLTVTDPENFDDGLLWDDGNSFDTFVIISSGTTSNSTCGISPTGIGFMTIGSTFIVD